jgi:GH25 family lysozyme M1 (1,4-beta-N-acetylmuramidase)
MYYYGIYSSVNAFSTHFDDDVKKKYAIWVAHWYVNKPSFKGKWGVWQYSEKGKVNGISGYVDIDHGDVNYENIIKKGHYNGY